ncbi:MAG: bifunctional phosphoribosylaminoimidazolecarboxamide formyltransferase/IMP cyclohydrolase [Bacteroidota bacterium]
MTPAAPQPLRIVILASGNGTNAQCIAAYFRDSELARVVLVLTNNPRAGVLDRAKTLGIPAEVMSRNVYGDGTALTARLRAAEADLVVLAGYLKLIPQAVVRAYTGRLINIHPALLPRHGGQGMYGEKVHAAVIAAGDRYSGITIHHVTEAYDEGPPILQTRLAVGDRTAKELAQAVHALEYRHFAPTIEYLLRHPGVSFMELQMKKIETALISVYHKDGLEDIARELDALGVRILSTGGTAKFIRDLGIAVDEVADLTAYPSILGGRVKTLHPKVFGGILARRENESDVATLEEYEIPAIDLVIVDLYPFEDTVASGAEESAIIEKIDIGGIALIRAAAKNFRDVLCLPSRELYTEFRELLVAQAGVFSQAQRKRFAAAAFDVSSHYDAHIYNYLSGGTGSLKISEPTSRKLRYGENPHQEAHFHGDLDTQFTQLHGKALSYNNLLDVDAALNLMADLQAGPPTFAVFKHTNPCGVATGKNPLQAWKRALAGDPVSAFGGIIIGNGVVEADVAEAISEIFFEVLIAEDFSAGALEILQRKKKRILLRQISKKLPRLMLRSAVNGYLLQEKDLQEPDPATYEAKTSRQATEAQTLDIVFAEKIGKHLKSNAIAIVKDQQLIGSGIGQTSRVDALNQAIAKAKAKGFDLSGSVLYSDAFFPFSDCAELAHAAGIEVLAEPGGSIRDQDTIDYCEKHSLCLVFTNYRHFKH